MPSGQVSGAKSIAPGDAPPPLRGLRKLGAARRLPRQRDRLIPVRRRAKAGAGADAQRAYSAPLRVSIGEGTIAGVHAILETEGGPCAVSRDMPPRIPLAAAGLPQSPAGPAMS